MKTTRRLLVVPLLLALAACATSPVSSMGAFGERSSSNSFEFFGRSVDPPETLVLPVAHDRQTNTAACGAHVLASVINYWRGEDSVSGNAIFAAHQPAAPDGYSLAEVMALAQQHGLTASAVRLTHEDIVRELENGRPVLVPIRVPSVYVQNWSLPGANVPVLGLPSSFITARVAQVSEWTDTAMVNHYVLVVGHDGDKFVVVEPVLGYRTISFDRLGRYREDFGNAAVVFSGQRPPPGNQVETPPVRAMGSM
ncbi:MAG TPA: papain-like cysteine protease family protein [Vitreimonas sp.]|uniref:papain-like cysteine protease family protein n=1 Tax=Vitreimonas sp. TaxID=3069702 RepID=UPI002D73084A|nr:papain-like cysteine protease family protein [Vitreimonas sp.]HYD87863.1 papain-like cysteine protease family protein [Vitreimonas sp.]